MFIHIGGDIMVRLNDVVGIFDARAKENPANFAWLGGAEANREMDITQYDEIKSFIVTKNKVYTSPISSLTLKKRADTLVAED